MTASRAACELAHFLVELCDRRGGGDGAHETSRETSSERAEWVSAPTEMKSTPVSANVADGVERDAAGCLERGATGDQRHGPAQDIGRHVVEQDPVGAGGERLVELVERVDLDLDRHGRVLRRGGVDARCRRRPRGAGGCP